MTKNEETTLIEDILNFVKKKIKKLTFFDYIFVLLLLLVAVQRISLMKHCLWIDEARELFITRNFLRTGHFTFFGEEYMQHPFGFYLSLAIASFFTAGLKDLTGEIVVMFSSLLCVSMTYLLGKELRNKTTGIIASVFVAFQSTYAFISGRILNDIPMVSMLTTAFYFFIRGEKRKEKKSTYLAGFFSALAMLMKISSITIMPTIILYLLWTKKLKWLKEKKYWIMILIFILTFSTWMIRNVLVGQNFFPFDLYFGRLEPGEHTLDVQPSTYYIKNFIPMFSLVLTIFFILGIILGITNRYKNQELLILWFSLFFILITLQTVKVPRYLLPILPAIALISAYNIDLITNALRKKIIIKYLIIILILLTYAVPMNKFSTTLIKEKARTFCGLKETGEFLKSVTKPNETIMCASNTQMHWYSDRNVVSFPGNETIFDNFVQENNVSYIVVDVWERTAPKYVFNNGNLWLPYFLNNSKYPFTGWAYPITNNSYATFVYAVNNNLNNSSNSENNSKSMS